MSQSIIKTVIIGAISKITSRVILSLAVTCPSAYALPIAAEPTTIDVMFLYSTAAEKQARGNIQTLIDHKIAVTNKIYADSGLNIKLRKVHSQKVTTSHIDSSETVLRRMTSNQREFSHISDLRKQYGADMVVMLRPYANDGVCGIAWVGGYHTGGDVRRYKNRMYSHVSISSCGSYVMAHEMGHNMGLSHSRRQNPGGGTFAYSAGYGIDGQFTTIMAYGSSFSTHRKFYNFSSPALTCDGAPCGVDQSMPDAGANAVETLKVTAPQIANMMPVKVH